MYTILCKCCNYRSKSIKHAGEDDEFYEKVPRIQWILMFLRGHIKQQIYELC